MVQQCVSSHVAIYIYRSNAVSRHMFKNALSGSLLYMVMSRAPIVEQRPFNGKFLSVLSFSHHQILFFYMSIFTIGNLLSKCPLTHRPCRGCLYATET